jgi:hypothetical protein
MKTMWMRLTRLVAVPVALFTLQSDVKTHAPNPSEPDLRFRIPGVLSAVHTHEDHDRFAGVDKRYVAAATTTSSSSTSTGDVAIFLKVM